MSTFFCFKAEQRGRTMGTVLPDRSLTGREEPSPTSDRSFDRREEPSPTSDRRGEPSPVSYIAATASTNASSISSSDACSALLIVSMFSAIVTPFSAESFSTTCLPELGAQDPF